MLEGTAKRNTAVKCIKLNLFEFTITIQLSLQEFGFKIQNMRPSVRFRIYGLIEALVVVIVVFLFRYLDRKTASIIATSLFIAVPAIFILVELRMQSHLQKALFYFGHGQFLIFFALPILYLNFIAAPIDPGSPPHILGLTMEQFHKYSNISYFVAAFSSFATSFVHNRRGE